jgi:hypothetical protein
VTSASRRVGTRGVTREVANPLVGERRSEVNVLRAGWGRGQIGQPGVLAGYDGPGLELDSRGSSPAEVAFDLARDRGLRDIAQVEVLIGVVDPAEYLTLGQQRLEQRIDCDSGPARVSLAADVVARQIEPQPARA